VRRIADNGRPDENMNEDSKVPGKMLTGVLAGFVIIIVGIVLIAVAALLSTSSGSVSGVIFLGPFPIVFGAGPDAIWLIAISIVIAVLMIVLPYVLRRRSLQV